MHHNPFFGRDRFPARFLPANSTLTGLTKTFFQKVYRLSLKFVTVAAVAVTTKVLQSTTKVSQKYYKSITIVQQKYYKVLQSTTIVLQ